MCCPADGTVPEKTLKGWGWRCCMNEAHLTIGQRCSSKETHVAHKTRTAQVLDIVKVLAWVVIAVALVKFAFFPAVQDDEGSDGMDPGGNFGQMTIEVGRADITNTVSVTGTIQADDPVVARATLDGNVVRTFVNDGDKIAKGDAIVQIRKEFPGETRQVTDEEGNVSVETSEPTYKYETVVSPGDGTVSTGVLVGQQFAIGDTVATVAPATFSAVAPLSADQMYRLQDAPSTATVTIKNGPAPFECSGVKLVSPTGKAQDPKSNTGSGNGASSSTDLKARCAIPSDQTVFAGLQVTLEMTAGSATGVLAVPISAVEGRYQSGTVYLPTSDPSKPEKRAVTLGITDGKMVEVKEGLTEGEEILEFTPTSNKDNQDGQTGPYGGMDSGMAGGPGGAAGAQ